MDEKLVRASLDMCIGETNCALCTALFNGEPLEPLPATRYEAWLSLGSSLCTCAWCWRNVKGRLSEIALCMYPRGSASQIAQVPSARWSPRIMMVLAGS